MAFRFANIVIPSDDLSATANNVKGTALPLDVTDAGVVDDNVDGAAVAILRMLGDGRGGTGITRDKLLANMNEGQWDAVLAVNLRAPVRITEKLIENGDLAPGAAVLILSMARSFLLRRRLPTPISCTPRSRQG